MILDEIICEAWPSLQETLFDCLEEACCFWTERCYTKILCQFWFVCLGQNIILHNLLFLYLHGNFPYSSLLVFGAFYYLFSIFRLTFLACLVWWCIHHHIRLAITTPLIGGVAFIFGKMCIYLACFLRPGIWSVSIRDESIVLPSGSLVFHVISNYDWGYFCGGLFW